MQTSDGDLARLTLEREVEKSRAEIAGLKTDIYRELSEVTLKISASADKKVSDAFSTFLSWSKAALIGVVLLGSIAAYMIKEYASDAIRTQIADWLSLERKGAILKDALEQARMRTVLDSMIVKMERSKLDRVYSPGIKLSPAEERRLVLYMLDRETPASDFNDGSRILGAALGPGSPFNENNIDMLLKEVFAHPSERNERALAVLRNLSRYAPISQYAAEILKEDDAPDDLREAAFHVFYEPFVRSDLAASYAKSHLLSEPSIALQHAYVIALANDRTAVPLVDEWLRRRSKYDDGSLEAITLADALAPRVDPHLSSFSETDDRKWAGERVASLMIDAIARGAQLEELDDAYPGMELLFRAKTGTSVRRPESLFDDKGPIMKYMVSAARQANLPPAAFVRALTTTGSRGELFAIRVELGMAAFSGIKFPRVDTSTTAGSVLLIAEPRDSQHPIHIRFRAADGSWQEDALTSLDDLYKGTLYFAYDPAFLDMAQRRNVAELYP